MINARRSPVTLPGAPYLFSGYSPDMSSEVDVRREEFVGLRRMLFETRDWLGRVQRQVEEIQKGPSGQEAVDYTDSLYELLLRVAQKQYGEISHVNKSQARVDWVLDDALAQAGDFYSPQDRTFDFPTESNGYLRYSILKTLKIFYAAGLEYNGMFDPEAATDEIYYGMRQLDLSQLSLPAFV